MSAVKIAGLIDVTIAGISAVGIGAHGAMIVAMIGGSIGAPIETSIAQDAITPHTATIAIGGSMLASISAQPFSDRATGLTIPGSIAFRRLMAPIAGSAIMTTSY